MKNISKAKMMTMRLPWPSFADQSTFAGRLTQLLLTREKGIRQAHELDTLFGSLQLRAFEGQL